MLSDDWPTYLPKYIFNPLVPNQTLKTQISLQHFMSFK